MDVDGARKEELKSQRPRRCGRCALLPYRGPLEMLRQGTCESMGHGAQRREVGLHHAATKPTLVRSLNNFVLSRLTVPNRHMPLDVFGLLD